MGEIMNKIEKSFKAKDNQMKKKESIWNKEVSTTLGNNLKGNLIIGTKEEEIVKIVLLYLFISSVSFVATFKVLTLNTRPRYVQTPLR